MIFLEKDFLNIKKKEIIEGKIMFEHIKKRRTQLLQGFWVTQLQRQNGDSWSLNSPTVSLLYGKKISSCKLNKGRIEKDFFMMYDKDI